MGAASNTDIGSYQRKIIKTKMTRLEKGDGLIHAPQILVSEPSVFQLIGQKEDPRTKPWGFWFGSAFLALTAFHVYHVGTSVAWSVREIVIGITILGIAVLFLRYGVTTRFVDKLVATLDANRGVLSVGERSFSIADIEEVVFGMVQFPVKDNGKGVTVHAFSLLIRIDDALIPIVEASPDKGALFEAAKLVSKISGAPLIQVGDGIRID